MRISERRKSSRRLICAVCQRLEPRRLLSAVSWDGGGDGTAWSDPLNWSADQLPISADDVTIAAGGPVVLNDADVTIRSLITSVPLSIYGHTLDVKGNVQFGADATIHAANLLTKGDLTLNNSTLYINLGYSNPASQLVFYGTLDHKIGGTGSIISLTDDQTSYISNETNNGGVGKKLTIGGGIAMTLNDVLLRSTTPGGYIENFGQISTTYCSFGDYNVSPPSANDQFINSGTITINNDSTGINLVNLPGGNVNIVNGTLDLEGDWHNGGAITIGDAGLILGGTFAFADLGTFSRTGSGGTVYLTGVLDNTGQTFTLNSTTGSWIANGGTLLGGVYNCPGADQLVIYDGTFSGVKVISPISIPGGTLRIRNGMTLNSSITLDYGITDHPTISFEGDADQTMGGTGSIISNSGDSTSPIINNTIDETGNGKQITFGAGIEISGPNLYIYSAYPLGTLVNDGTFTATNWTVGSYDGTLVNNGSIAGDIYLQLTNLQNNGDVVATGAFFLLDGNTWHNSGSMDVIDSDLYLGGIFAASDLGIWTRSGAGTTHLIGTLENSSSTFTLDEKIRSLYLQGIVLGGTIDATVDRGQPLSSGNQLLGYGGVLVGVTLDAPATIDPGQAIYVNQNLTLNSTITLLGDAAGNAYGMLAFDVDNDQLLDGTGTINAASDDNGYGYLINYMTGTLTIGSGIHVTGKYLDQFGNAIVNYGTFTADIPGSVWLLGDQPNFENRGTISVTNGAAVSINNLVNDAGQTIYVGTSSLLMLKRQTQQGGTIDLNGALVIDYDDASPLATVAAQVLSGYAGGAWNGTGITSSSAAAVAGDVGNPAKTAIGYAEASALGIVGNGLFAGQIVDDTSVCIRYTLRGDANLDTTVDTIDFNLLATNFSKTDQGWFNADFNYNNTVDTIDFNLLAAHFSKSLPAAAPAARLVDEVFGRAPIIPDDVL